MPNPKATSSEMANAPVLHWEGAGTPPQTEEASRARWEAIRRTHKAADYFDIAYNHGCGDDGTLLTGRGWDRDSAANGHDKHGVNRNPGSRVFCWLGGPGHAPSPAALACIRRWAVEARRRGYTAALTDHQGLGVQTACAGPDIRWWIATGAPTAAGGFLMALSDGEQQEILDFVRLMREGASQWGVPKLLPTLAEIDRKIGPIAPEFGVGPVAPAVSEVRNLITALPAGPGGGLNEAQVRTIVADAVRHELDQTRLAPR